MLNLLKIKFRFIYKPVIDAYRAPKSHLRNRKDAEFWASQLNLHYRNSRSDSITVIYSDEDTPPLYADFLVVVLLVRFLTLQNIKVNFYVSNFGRFGAIWNSLSYVERRQYNLDQKKILVSFLPASTKVIFSKKPRTVIENIALRKSNLILSRPKIDGIAPYIIDLLISRHKLKMPNNFLLKSEKHRSYGSYITFGVRRSKWDSFRDSSKKTIKKDFLRLNKIFPDKNIILLSNCDGLNYAFKALFDSDKVKTTQYKNIQVIPQPKSGYFNGIELLLGSEFYFQRSGGGMIVPAIFSEIPYLFLHQMKLNFYGKSRNSLVSWSSKTQIYLSIPQLFVKIFPIKYFLKKIKL